MAEILDRLPKKFIFERELVWSRLVVESLGRENRYFVCADFEKLRRCSDPSRRGLPEVDRVVTKGPRQHRRGQPRLVGRQTKLAPNANFVPRPNRRTAVSLAANKIPTVMPLECERQRSLRPALRTQVG